METTDDCGADLKLIISGCFGEACPDVWFVSARVYVCVCACASSLQ